MFDATVIALFYMISIPSTSRLSEPSFLCGNVRGVRGKWKMHEAFYNRTQCRTLPSMGHWPKRIPTQSQVKGQENTLPMKKPRWKCGCQEGWKVVTHLSFFSKFDLYFQKKRKSPNVLYARGILIHWVFHLTEFYNEGYQRNVSFLKTETRL